jgi:hypothetical protein
MPDSDSLYHRLFAHPLMVEELVREFVPLELVSDLDFSGLQRINPKFHSGRRSARRRESDVIWRLPTNPESGVYLYLMIEFQSECDRWMAVRSLVYQGLLWQQVIDEQKMGTGAQLPPLLLLLLYNGERPWRSPTSARDLIALSADSALWPWQPQVRYYLLDIGALPKEELQQRPSLVPLLFRLEQRHSPEALQELLAEVRDWFRRHAGYERLRGLFAELVREAFVGHGVKMSGSGDLWEMKSMLATQLEAWREQWLAEGRAKGKAEALVCLLMERFGELDVARQRQIFSAELTALDRWLKLAVVSPDLDSVFNAPS